MDDRYHHRFSWPGLTRLSTFQESAEPDSPVHGIYRVYQWADVQLVAVIPQHPHPPGTSSPLPPGTVTKQVDPFEIPAADTWHPVEHSLLDYYPLLVRFELGPYWDVRMIFSTWARQIRAQFEQAHTVRSSRRGRHTDEYRRWIELTEALADDPGLGFRAEHQVPMLEAAAAVDRAVSWADTYVSAAPGDARGRAELFLTIHVWAIDRFVDAVNAFWRCAAPIAWTSGPPLKPPQLRRSELLRTVLESWPEAESDGPILPEEKDPDAWKMRIKRLGARIRPGQHDALMAAVLKANT